MKVARPQVTLRRPVPHDLKLLHALDSNQLDSELANPMGFNAIPSSILEDRLRRGDSAPLTGARGSEEFTIESHGMAIGIAGLYEIDLYNRVTSIGVSLASSRGQGLGYAAHVALLNLAFSREGIDRVVGHIKSPNVPAIRVAERLGMTLEGRLRAHRRLADARVDLLVYGILRDEWVTHGSSEKST